MEMFMEFNGVKVLLTTGQKLEEVQNFSGEADVIISVYPEEIRVLRGPASVMVGKKAGFRWPAQ